jgi:tetratricopeptide (TPR) repeat protein
MIGAEYAPFVFNMIKRTLVLLCLLALSSVVRAGDAEGVPADSNSTAPSIAPADQNLIDEFFGNAASKNSEGEKLKTDGKNDEAAAAFHKALGYLDLLHAKFPQWDQAAVTKRRMEIKHNLSAVETDDHPDTAVAVHPVSGNGYALRRPMAEEFEHALRRMAAEELITKGGDLLEIGLPRLAIPYFREALKYDPGNPDASGQLENALMRDAGSNIFNLFF